MADHFNRDGSQPERARHFERAIWPHLHAAHNFARWIVRDPHDAEDVVQESFMKAFRAAGTFHGTNLRAWLLAIVRNSAHDFLNRRKRPDLPVAEQPEPVDPSPDPEASLLQKRRADEVRAAIGRLPVEFREAILLRELEELSYKEIAQVLKVPLGTVMSRISRARNLLVEELIAVKESNR